MSFSTFRDITPIFWPSSPDAFRILLGRLQCSSSVNGLEIGHFQCCSARPAPEGSWH